MPPTYAWHFSAECPQCGQPLRLVRSHANVPFVGCTGYPNCRFSSDTEELAHNLAVIIDE